jgi:hypothetical protein
MTPEGGTPEDGTPEDKILRLHMKCRLKPASKTVTGRVEPHPLSRATCGWLDFPLSCKRSGGEGD